jgi:hypothetical protein
MRSPLSAMSNSHPARNNTVCFDLTVGAKTNRYHLHRDTLSAFRPPQDRRRSTTVMFARPVADLALPR